MLKLFYRFQHLATLRPAATTTTIRIGIVANDNVVADQFCTTILGHALFEDKWDSLPLKGMVSPLLRSWYAQNEQRTLVPQSSRLSGEDGTSLELVRLDNFQDRSISINALLLLLPTNLSEVTECSLRDAIRDAPVDIPLNVLCVVDGSDVNQHMENYDESNDNVALRAATALHKVAVSGGGGGSENKQLYSIRFGRIDQDQQAWRSLFLAQHSVLYPTARLRGKAFTQACGIIFAACNRRGTWDWNIFERVVFGGNTLTSTGKKELEYLHGHPESVKDVCDWFTRLIHSGKASLVWVALRNFGFNGALEKKRMTHHKSQIPTRLVK